MLRAHAAQRHRAALGKRQQRRQGLRLSLHLRQRFHHHLRRAAGAGSFQPRLCFFVQLPILRVRFAFRRHVFQASRHIQHIQAV